MSPLFVQCSHLTPCLPAAGSRIDLILAADGRDPSSSGVRSWVTGADIMPEFKGSDHCPVWVQLQVSVPVDRRAWSWTGVCS